MKNLFYFEDSVESGFGKSDIQRLSGAFVKTVIFASKPSKEYPVNVSVEAGFLDWNNFAPGKIMAMNFGLIVLILLSAAKEIGFSPKRLSEAIKKVVSNIFRANEIVKYARMREFDLSQTLMYSFWFYDSLFLAVMKAKYPEVRVINRAHGGDIFEDQSSLSGKVLLREYQLRKLDDLITVSKDGAEYLKTKYPKYASKIRTSYLGTLGHEYINPFSTDSFTIVSCSHVRDIKRVDNIAESVGKLNFPVIWYHIGRENEELINVDFTVGRYFELKEILLRKSNIRFVPTGEWQPRQIMNFYKNTPVNLFISLSTTEGLPVSMMESLSFGIPIMATDVGGCREAVNSKTGVLLNYNIGPNDVARQIERFRSSELNRAEVRAQIKKFWSENFDQEENYKRFLQTI